MKTLFKNGYVVNVFTDSLDKANVLIEGDKILGVGDYTDADAERSIDLDGAVLCPGLIDSHMHIESTMLTPANLAGLSLAHGTTSVIADPHEIANVCGRSGIQYMLEASEGLPLHVFFALSSCVPAGPYDESSEILNAAALEEFYDDPRVVALAEMMNYPGVLAGDEDIMRKIEDAAMYGRLVDGHAPLLRGRDLDRYITAGVESDHECSSLEEAMEKLSKGQHIIIRNGTAAKNLEALLPLLDEPYSRRCLLCTDDRHPADLMAEGHMDVIIRKAVKAGKSPFAAIRAASLQAAEYFGLMRMGAVACGYRADLLVVDNLEDFNIRAVYTDGVLAAEDGRAKPFKTPAVSAKLYKAVHNSFNLDKLSPQDLYIEPKGSKCRVIGIIPGQLLTDELIEDIDWSRAGGIDTDRDILKLAVIERHNNTGHRGLGFIKGTGLKCGAIAASVSHDSHNLIVIGVNDEDMAAAANHVIEMGGGNCVVKDGSVLCDMPLPVAGLMSELEAKQVAEQNIRLREAVALLGCAEGVEPFMNMNFVSLTVIPSLKMTTLGLVDVNMQEIKQLYAE